MFSAALLYFDFGLIIGAGIGCAVGIRIGRMAAYRHFLCELNKPTDQSHGGW